ncbi:MAG TPA: excinuclease ABC subunit UvrB [Candidatus Hydrothermia bacterium]|nr:excinuclease ABC subunit UvrB [Candidatus Hydrothermae bacterium]MDD3649344.1 excinuclease ABC subunit UvrB [Candidatus Hydrothermia bacterium]HOK22759.1 excinuclease ABC subunit UvrB [Candidatus Hydrothermia bacterium]HOL23468.1 excinuclease ABC subunit UvrB [Candidatus Hydrothermia bacterium]HOP32405.1 excinuclease ABC subunit UvrB [Candidatus Hydrothermia bacterium]
MTKFELVTELEPKGDQPKAIREIVENFRSGVNHQVLLGVTGSGKTFTMANVIKELGLPTLVVSHNKTLAAQLFGEFRSLFPRNAVEYFISYYDYYLPEAYIPETDTYVEKEADINEDIERLRLRATSSLIERDDVIVVASVSAIYGLGDPEDIRELYLLLEVGQDIKMRDLLDHLVDLQYTRNDVELKRGTFRVRGGRVDIVPAYEEYIVRVQIPGDSIESISILDRLTNRVIDTRERVLIYPAGHWVTTRSKLERALESIEIELEERLKELFTQGKLLEAQRLERRTKFDLEMLREVGYCPGIENYSRHLSGRSPGERPFCLIDYFPNEYLTIIDESHVTVPQLMAMYNGDRSRKEVLVEFGFRLPSALDNRPLKFEEVESMWDKVLFVSATPAEYELRKSNGVVVEQVIRPTGLVDPEIIVRPSENQVEDMVEEIRQVIERGERVLITTLTKRTAEDLADYLTTMGFRVKYLHSEIDALERVEIIRGLRLGEFDVLVGVNLLREGLDLPEVSLVVITDADKTGFLRSETALIQTAGRAARNACGRVILYANEVTEAMERAINETRRRREIQVRYNMEHNIVPQTIKKSTDEILRTTTIADERAVKRDEGHDVEEELNELLAVLPVYEAIEEMERRMFNAASLLDFEKAAKYRDVINKVKKDLGHRENRIAKSSKKRVKKDY